MSIRIGSNIASLQAQRSLGKTSDSLDNVYTRLSSGMRINRASDDAAGLAVAGSLNADIRIHSQAIRNLNDGISALSIADGALNNLSGIVIRLKELTFQAANGVYGFSQRSSLNSEALSLVKEFNRITGSTTFNGRKLIDGTMRELSLQAGRGNNSIINAGIGSGLGRYVGTGIVSSSAALSFTSGGDTNEISMVDLYGDGNVDMVHGGSTTATSGYMFEWATAMVHLVIQWVILPSLQIDS